MRKSVFMTFGGPSPYYNAVNRICNEARQFGFDEVCPFTDKDIKNTAFWEKHGSFIEKNHRGYGYWTWKPYLIQKKLAELKEGDILLYTDCGCEINIQGKPRFREYISLLDKSDYGVLSFELEHPEKKYTKRAIFEWFDSTDKDSVQCMTTAIVIKKNEHSVMVIDEWVKNTIYELINDETKNEDPEFIENRHDQSIYSMVVKKHGSIKLKDETYYLNWKDGQRFPILAKRNKFHKRIRPVSLLPPHS